MNSLPSSTVTPRLILLAFTAILLMSFVPVLVKAVNTNEISIAIVRLAIGAVGIALLTFATKEKLLTKTVLPWMILLGGVFALHWFTYFKSLKMATVSLGAIGVATFGVHLLILNSIFFKERIQKVDIFAIAMAMLGVWLVTPNQGLSPQHFEGFILAIVSGFLYACLPIIHRKATQLTTQQKAFGQFAFGLCFFAPFVSFGQWQMGSIDWLNLVVLGIVCTLVAHTLWIKVCTELPNSITATVYYFYVPIAMMFSYFIFDEQLPWQKLLGAGLIICANIIVILLHRKKV